MQAVTFTPSESFQAISHVELNLAVSTGVLITPETSRTWFCFLFFLLTASGYLKIPIVPLKCYLVVSGSNPLVREILQHWILNNPPLPQHLDGSPNLILGTKVR